MKLLKKGSILNFFIYFTFIYIVFCFDSSAAGDNDPFKSLGIPDLNPKQLLEEMDSSHKKKNNDDIPRLKSIEDLPNFLKNSKINEEDAIKVLSRFLIQDDITLKKYGVVYDQTGFDGIPNSEKISPIGTEERLLQRSRSAAKIWFKEKYPNLDYEAYGAEQMNEEIIANWRVYKVMMIGKNSENSFIKVCLPIDESENALCSDTDEKCAERAEYVDQEKKKNEDYIEKIKTNNFFKKKNHQKQAKLSLQEQTKAKNINMQMNTQNINQNKNAVNSNFNLNANIANMIPQNYAQFAMANNPAQRNFFINNNSNSLTGQFQRSYNFKQMDANSNIPPSGNNLRGGNFLGDSNGFAANNNYAGFPGQNSQNDMNIYKEIMEMKNQLSQMMNSLKQKENLITQNNQRLGDDMNNFMADPNAMSMNMNMNTNNMNMGMNNPQQYGNNNALNYNTMNNVNQMGLTAYMQYTGTNPFIQQNNVMNNNIGANNNQMPINSHSMNKAPAKPKEISSVL